MAKKHYQIFRGAKKNYDFFLAGTKIASKYCTESQGIQIAKYLEAKCGFIESVIFYPNLND